MILIYGYGGGHTRRLAVEAFTRMEAHKALDEALDKGYTIITFTVEEARP